MAGHVVFRPGIPPESAGWPGGEHAVAVEDGVRIERNVAVPMRDGLRLLVDVYRAEQVDHDLPALIAWAPFGKHGAVDWAAFEGHEVDLDALSAELLGVVDQTMQPTTTSLWLRPTAELLASDRGRGS